MRHVRTGKDIKISDAVTFKAGERALVEEAVSGDIIGLHNHGTIQIGDTFTTGEDIRYTGIPHFAPELFRRIRLADPLKAKALQKGPQQLSEEGSTQVFAPIRNTLATGHEETSGRALFSVASNQSSDSRINSSRPIALAGPKSSSPASVYVV